MPPVPLLHLQRRRHWYSISFFHIVALSLLVADVYSAASPTALRVEGLFTLLLGPNGNGLDESNSSAVASLPCPRTIEFTKITTYRGINPSDANSTYHGILWQDLIINGLPCQASKFVSTSTYFTQAIQSPPDTPPADANPYFLIGFDNSPLRCPTFSGRLPFRYYFTDDLPHYRDSIVSKGFLPTNLAPYPLRGDIYLFALGMDINNDVISAQACPYQEAGALSDPPDDPFASPEPTDEARGGRACLSSHMLVPLQHSNRARKARIATSLAMRDLRVGDPVPSVSMTVTKGPVGVADAIVSFSHRDDEEWATFIALSVTMPSNATRELEVTGGHIVLRYDGTSVFATDVRVGDHLLAYENQVRSAGRVTGVSLAKRRGVYSPITQSGWIVVNDIVITCYTDAVRDAITAHAMLAPIRATYWLGFGDWCPIIDIFRSHLL